ncbi:DNA photolyase family protein [Brevibacterium sp. 50QC2O2]|uniref:cryptochrome/photolyase family protein n=1 Tax=Brevibacterium TaxID=1696 RepID=UPI00211C27BD|nr:MULTISPECIES: deoxyribodipyrimidine photo-lyase [unclassified Brevibacterium]MCQ9386696.1 DNA photolyase family protein [Brevibacterium sp. 68QC2CO]MCQ9389350.1 DNA photolyase family protein [Brevibacterium sp. 50QC2O2]
MTTLIWFRDDLRLTDHPALHAAASESEDTVALYVLDEESEHVRPLGGAARWWLNHSLRALSHDLGNLGVPLILRRGPAAVVVPEVARECGAKRIRWNRRYGPARQTDALIKAELCEAGRDARSFPGDLLFEPWTVKTRQGTSYRVYSAFWKAATAGRAPVRPLPAPHSLTAAPAQPGSEQLDDWGLLPHAPDWAAGLAKRWSPGEAAAQEHLRSFLSNRLTDYADRDFPARSAGSELSPHLRWGELSPRTVWHKALEAAGDPGAFLSELGWREFAKHTEYHAGSLAGANLDDRFDRFPWRMGPEVDTGELRAWQRGRTGFGIVDAGMRELWQTGFMHNRVRMIAASLLTKNLLFDWHIGEAWFWDTLVDADGASNPFNWQWVAGCGADAAPYFRIFNPELQQRRFDPEGHYTNRWAPDSAALTPLVDLRESRARALEAYRSLPH